MVFPILYSIGCKSVGYSLRYVDTCSFYPSFFQVFFFIMNTYWTVKWQVPREFACEAANLCSPKEV